MRTRRLLVLLVLTTLAAGCGNQRGPDSAKPSLPESSQQLRPNERDAVDALALGAAGDPSDFQWGDQIFHFLTEEGRVVDEQPWTACLGNGCWDGGPGLGGPIPSVGSPDALYFAFDYPGWKFHWVSFNPVDDECGGRSITVRATPVTDRIFREDAQGTLITETPHSRLLVRGWAAMAEELVLGWKADPQGITRDQLLEVLVASLPALVAVLPAERSAD